MYRPLLSADRTAVSTTARMTTSAPGRPIADRALMYGLSSVSWLDQGRIATTRKTDPT